MLRKKVNIVIAQGGGPTAVINQSLAGAVSAALDEPHAGNILGAVHGIDGVLNREFIDMRRLGAGKLKTLASTPSSALGSVRHKPTEDDCRRMFEVFKEHSVGAFFYIGGNDSAETASIMASIAAADGFPLRCFHIPKTIDNDLCENDHTPGYGSAARFVAMAFLGDDLDNLALGGVKINIVMGRHAGFLTAASALARSAGGGPHLIYLPERTFSMSAFVSDVDRVMSKYGRCVAAVSEGICGSGGVPVAVAGATERDSHGNIQLSGTGALGDMLAAEVKNTLGIRRVRSDTFGYIQRSFPGAVSPVDSREARRAGEEAVRAAFSGDADSGSIAITREGDGASYCAGYKLVALSSVAGKTRRMPDGFISESGCDVTGEFIEYAAPLAGRMPRTVRLIR